MKREEIEQLAKDSLADLRNALKAGKSEAMTRYLQVMARFHHYSFRNALLIAVQSPLATHVAGFRAWLKMCRCVRKGEKAIAIIAPLAYRDADAAGRPDSEGYQVRGFRVAHVFDVSQTDGEDLPRVNEASGEPGAHFRALLDVVAGRGIALEYVDSLGGSLGRSGGGRITLVRGLSPAEEFSTLAHELAHELLHHKEGEVRPPKAVRETEAEAVAYVVSRAAGLEAQTVAADYILLHGGDEEALEGSLGRIQKTSAEIIGALRAAA